MTRRPKLWVFTALTLALTPGLFAPGCGGNAPESPSKDAPKSVSKDTVKAAPQPLPKNASPPGADRPDSYAWYGLGADTYTAAQRDGRDTWIFWTGGNQKFFRLGTQLGGDIGVSIEYFRLLDSRDRATRFERLGLINEPNCKAATKPDEYGLWLDEWAGNPYPDAYPDTKIYGEPSGVIGFRKFKNEKFDADAWKQNGGAEGYFKAPSKVEPPYVIGMTCGFCHMGFHPLRPPNNPSEPKWENLAANLGNQYLHEGRVFFGSGKVVYGSENDGKGLGTEDFFHHLGETQERGTSETSRLSYDFINNPNVINSIFFLHNRPSFQETFNPEALDQVKTLLNPGDPTPPIHHILKDGSDSQSIPIASIRVYVNIGMYGEYWVTRLWSPLHPKTPQKPFDMKVALAESADWRDTLKRMPNLEAYLATYTPMSLEKAPGAIDKGQVIPDAYRTATDPAQKAKWDTVQRGQVLFADQCARCHSSKPKPPEAIANDSEKVREYYRQQVAQPDFLENNTLTDDVRYPVSELKTNAGRALATNATAEHVWDQFSSPEYKNLPPSGPLLLDNPADPTAPRVWQPPGGGVGYYRTASLINIWATAPFLHNNSVGKFPGDLALKPEQWPTVDGRLAAFNDAIGKLLNPKTRAGQGSIKRVGKGGTNFYLRLEGLADRLPEFKDIEEVKDVAKDLFQKIDLLDLRDRLPGLPHMQLAVKFPVPEDTPINLLANVHVKNALDAVPEFLKYKAARLLGDKALENKAVDALLKLSEYPDLVEDHGHDYGADLSDDDKAALIEYLKKL